MRRQKPPVAQASLFPSSTVSPSRAIWGMGKAYVIVTRIPAGTSESDRLKALKQAQALAKLKQVV